MTFSLLRNTGQPPLRSHNSTGKAPTRVTPTQHNTADMSIGRNHLMDMFNVNPFSLYPEMSETMVNGIKTLCTEIAPENMGSMLENGLKLKESGLKSGLKPDRFTTLMKKLDFTSPMTQGTLAQTITHLSLTDLSKTNKDIDTLITTTKKVNKVKFLILIKCQLQKRLDCLLDTSKLDTLRRHDVGFSDKFLDDDGALTTEAFEQVCSTTLFGIDPRLISLRRGNDVFQDLLNTVKTMIDTAATLLKTNTEAQPCFPPSMFRTGRLQNTGMTVQLDGGKSVQQAVSGTPTMDVGRLVKTYLKSLPEPLISVNTLLSIVDSTFVLAGNNSLLLTQRRKNPTFLKNNEGVPYTPPTITHDVARARIKCAIDNMEPSHKAIFGKFITFFYDTTQHADILTTDNVLVEKQKWATGPGIAYPSIFSLDDTIMANLYGETISDGPLLGYKKLEVLSIAGHDFIVSCLNDPEIRRYVTA